MVSLTVPSHWVPPWLWSIWFPSFNENGATPCLLHKVFIIFAISSHARSLSCFISTPFNILPCQDLPTWKVKVSRILWLNQWFNQYVDEYKVWHCIHRQSSMFVLRYCPGLNFDSWMINSMSFRIKSLSFDFKFCGSESRFFFVISGMRILKTSVHLSMSKSGIF